MLGALQEYTQVLGGNWAWILYMLLLSWHQSDIFTLHWCFFNLHLSTFPNEIFVYGGSCWEKQCISSLNNSIIENIALFELSVYRFIDINTKY
jgi:hypothetical protein